jgi:hypothetical protein
VSERIASSIWRSAWLAGPINSRARGVIEIVKAAQYK